MKRKRTRKLFLSLIVLFALLLNHGISYGSWTSWKGVEGWVGLDYQLQSQEKKSGWKFKIQFRNRYSQRINFNVMVHNGSGSQRVSVEAGGTEKSDGYLTKENLIVFTVEKVRFGSDNELDSFAPPDGIQDNF